MSDQCFEKAFRRYRLRPRVLLLQRRGFSHFVQGLARQTDSKALLDHLACLVALVHVAEEIMKANRGQASKDRLDKAVGVYLQLYQDLYGERAVIFKSPAPGGARRLQFVEMCMLDCILRKSTSIVEGVQGEGVHNMPCDAVCACRASSIALFFRCAVPPCPSQLLCP